MRENRTYGSEGGEPVMGNSPTPISGHSRSLRADTQVCPYNSWFSVAYSAPEENAFHTHMTRMKKHGCHMGVSWVSHACRIRE